MVCGEAEIVREIRGGDSLLNPSVIVEVLSPSTEEYDRGDKVEDDYRFIPSLREYVLVSQDEPLVEVRSRDEAGNGSSREYRAGDQASIPAIGVAVEVDAVYREARKNLARTPELGSRDRRERTHAFPPARPSTEPDCR